MSKKKRIEVNEGCIKVPNFAEDWRKGFGEFMDILGDGSAVTDGKGKGRGQGNGGGWPSTTGKPSGRGRSNG